MTVVRTTVIAISLHAADEFPSNIKFGCRVFRIKIRPEQHMSRRKRR